MGRSWVEIARAAARVPDSCLGTARFCWVRRLSPNALLLRPGDRHYRRLAYSGPLRGRPGRASGVRGNRRRLRSAAWRCEVEQFGSAVGSDEDVSGLEVAVHDEVAMA